MLIEYSTTLVDEEVGVCVRSIDPEPLFISHALMGIWSLSHHTSGRNTVAIIEQAWRRCYNTSYDIIATPADRV